MRTILLSLSLLLSTHAASAATQFFNIAIGDTVSDGVPEAGAGNIENPFDMDVYTFTVTAGEIIFFDRLTSNIGSIDMQLTDPDGMDLLPAERSFGQLGLLELTKSGTYTLTIGEDDNATTGTYSFTIWDVPPPDQFAINIGDTVSDGDPAPGAGNIESPGVRDIYTFPVTAGEIIFFDRLTSNIGSINMQLTDPDGMDLLPAERSFGQLGVLELTKSGTYTLTIGEDDNATTGTYSFTIWDVPPPDVFAISIGDTVSDGVPGPGAGNIESPGVRDIYTFSAAPGQVVFIDRISSNIGSINMAITDEEGNELVPAETSFGDREMVELTLGGTYTLTIGEDDNATTGIYSFQIVVEGASGGDIPEPAGLTAGDRFGLAVAADGNLIVVGAPAGTEGGVVYVYRFEGILPVFEEAIPIPDGFTADNFGAALALENGVLVVGAPQSTTTTAKGAVNSMRSAILQRLGGCDSGTKCWTLTTAVAPSGTQDASDGFGSSVALSGGTVVIGAPDDSEDEPAGMGSGAAYVFEFDGSSAVQTAKPKPFFGQPGAGFGTATATSGPAVAVGAPGAQSGGSQGGVVSLFQQIGGNLSGSTPVPSPSGASGAAFGSAIAISGETMVVGAPGDGGGSGSAAVFDTDGDNFTLTQTLTPVGAGGGFGTAVDISRDSAAVGAPGESAVYIYKRIADRLAAFEKVTGPAGIGFGSAVAITGDRSAIGAPQAMSDTGAATYRLLNDDVIFQSDFE